MEVSPEQQRAQGEPLGAEARSASVSSLLPAVVADLAAVATAWVELVGAEARTAVRAMVMMVAFGVGAGGIVISAWLFLVGAGVAGAVGLGAPAWLALLVAALLHVAAAAVLAFVVLRLSRRLSFPVTREALAGSIQNDGGTHTKTSAD